MTVKTKFKTVEQLQANRARKHAAENAQTILEGARLQLLRAHQGMLSLGVGFERAGESVALATNDLAIGIERLRIAIRRMP